MIYSRWGASLTIVANHGLHEIRGYNSPVHLLRAVRPDGTEAVYYAHGLRADEGIREIMETAREAPFVPLTAQDVDRLRSTSEAIY